MYCCTALCGLQVVIRDDLYWERYERAKLTAREAQRKAAKQREEADAAVAGAQAAADGEGHGEWQVRIGCLTGCGQWRGSGAGFISTRRSGWTVLGGHFPKHWWGRNALFQDPRQCMQRVVLQVW